MVGLLNDFKTDLVTLITNGYTKNGVQHLGTGTSSKIFNVKLYDASDRPFEVLKTRPTEAEFALKAPWISVGNIRTDETNFVGGSARYIVTVTFDCAFAQEHNKTVSSTELKQEELALYLMEQLHKGIKHGTDQFTLVKTTIPEYVAQREQSGRFGDSLLYGFTLQLRFEVY